jgi:hypothetical protein
MRQFLAGNSAHRECIGYVTNGIHVPTFLSSVWANHLDERLPQWRDRLGDTQYWAKWIDCRTPRSGPPRRREVTHAQRRACATGTGIRRSAWAQCGCGITRFIDPEIPMC